MGTVPGGARQSGGSPQPSGGGDSPRRRWGQSPEVPAKAAEAHNLPPDGKGPCRQEDARAQGAPCDHLHPPRAALPNSLTKTVVPERTRWRLLRGWSHTPARETRRDHMSRRCVAAAPRHPRRRRSGVTSSVTCTDSSVATAATADTRPAPGHSRAPPARCREPEARRRSPLRHCHTQGRRTGARWCGAPRIAGWLSAAAPPPCHGLLPWPGRGGHPRAESARTT